MNDSPLAVGVDEVGEVFAPTPDAAEASNRTMLFLAGAAALIAAYWIFEEVHER